MKLQHPIEYTISFLPYYSQTLQWLEELTLPLFSVFPNERFNPKVLHMSPGYPMILEEAVVKSLGGLAISKQYC